MPTATNKWRFEVEPNVFQDFHRADAQPHEKISTQPSLGLLTKMFQGDGAAGFDQRSWTRLELHVKYLNEHSDDNTSYKVLYLTRHGLGYHNKKHTEVGNDKWNVSLCFLPCESDNRFDQDAELLVLQRWRWHHHLV